MSFFGIWSAYLHWNKVDEELGCVNLLSSLIDEKAHSAVTWKGLKHRSDFNIGRRFAVVCFRADRGVADVLMGMYGLLHLLDHFRRYVIASTLLGYNVVITKNKEVG